MLNSINKSSFALCSCIFMKIIILPLFEPKTHVLTQECRRCVDDFLTQDDTLATCSSWKHDLNGTQTTWRRVNNSTHNYALATYAGWHRPNYAWTHRQPLRQGAENQIGILRDWRMIDRHDLWLKWWILIGPRITQSGEMDAMSISPPIKQICH